MILFKKRKNPVPQTTDSPDPTLSSVITKINTIVDLVKDLEPANYNRLREGMDLIYKGYQKVRKSGSKEEKEHEEIDKVEGLIEMAEQYGA